MSYVLAGDAQPDARRVLVSDGAHGQGRSALAAVQALGVAGFEPVVTVTSTRSLAAASRWCRGRIHVPAVRDDPAGYAQRLAQVLGHPGVLLALPASDAALLALAAPGHDLVDKRHLADRAAAAGLTGTPGIVARDRAGLEAAVEAFGYPVVIKPTVSNAPAIRVIDHEALEHHLHEDAGSTDVLVQPYLTEPVHAVAGLLWDDDLLLAVHQRYLRTWPSDCGTSSAAVTTAPDDALEGGLVRLLQGYRGIFQAQFAGPYLLDLNLRVYGSLPLAVAAGLNLPAALCDLVAGRSVPSRRARAGHRYRWPEGDVRSLVAARRDGRIGWFGALQALRPRRGTAHSVYRLSDPSPALLRLTHAAARARGHRGP